MKLKPRGRAKQALLMIKQCTSWLAVIFENKCYCLLPESFVMSSHGLEAFCLDASYIAAFNIFNLPSLANLESSRPLLLNLSWLASSNVTIYTDDRASILANFEYEEIVSLPLSKPLTIQCPVPACIFPISGYFTFLQRLLLYINIGIATFSLHVLLLRGVSQIWLTTFWFSVLFMFIATIATTKVPMIYNLDFNRQYSLHMLVSCRRCFGSLFVPSQGNLDMLQPI
jgi:hypothetical protein